MNDLIRSVRIDDVDDSQPPVAEAATNHLPTSLSMFSAAVGETQYMLGFGRGDAVIGNVFHVPLIPPKVHDLNIR